MGPKFKHILPRYFTIVLIVCVLYPFLRWIFVIELRLIELEEKIWEFWIPMILSLAGILLWVRKPLRILELKSRNDKLRDLYIAIATISIIPPAIIVQIFVAKQTGELVQVNYPSEIKNNTTERYYELNNFTVDKNRGACFQNRYVSGKHSDRLNFENYFVFPVCDSLPQGNCHNVWCGIRYYKSLKNNLADEQIAQESQWFYEENTEEFYKFNFNAVTYFENTPVSDDRNLFIKSAQLIDPALNEKSIVILEPQMGQYENRAGKTFMWIFLSFAIGFTVFLVALWIPAYSEKELERQQKGLKPLEEDYMLEVLGYFIPRGNHFSAAILMDLNILVFIVMIISGVSLMHPLSSDLVNWGGLYEPKLASGEWWRLITCTFLHAGILHLVYNIVGLGLGAVLLSNWLNRLSFFVLYFASGIGGSLASIWWHDNTVGVGASGAIFGLYGAIAGMIVFGKLSFEENKVKLMLVMVMLISNLLVGLAGGVDNAAHLGGFATGILVGTLLHYFQKKSATVS